MKKQRIEFFIKSYFFAFSDNNISLERILNRAYLDLCRTLPNVGKINQKQIRNSLTNQIRELESKEFTNQSDFDKWHETNCKELTSNFNLEYRDFNIGHAQKWINMILKYCFLLSEYYPKISKNKDFFHCPIDGIILDILKDKEYGYSTNIPWSKIKNYHDYFQIQVFLRNNIKDKSVIEWELEVFNKQ